MVNNGNGKSSSTRTSKTPSLTKIKVAATVKLDNSNFFSWKAQTVANLRGHDLLTFIEQPVDKENAVAVQQDQLLLGWLFSALSPTVLSQVASYTTSYEVWAALQGIFNIQSKSRKLQLRHELSTFKKDGLSADEYLAALSKKADEVRDAGISMDDGELTLIALDGLDASYDAFVTAVTASAGDLTFAEFKGLLRANEKRHTREAEKIFPAANLAQSTRLGDALICQICSKPGHSAIACFNRHNKQRFPTPPNPRRGRYKGRPHYSNKLPNANAGWYADSGCTDHVAVERENMKETDSTPNESGSTN